MNPGHDGWGKREEACHPHLPEDGGKKPALILAFSPRRRESLFPRLVNPDAPNLRRFMGERGDFKSGKSPHGETCRLLHRDAFGEVAGFVHVAAAGHGDVVGKELQWHAGQNGV